MSKPDASEYVIHQALKKPPEFQPQLYQNFCVIPDKSFQLLSGRQLQSGIASTTVTAFQS